MCVATRGLVSAEISLYGPSADLHCGASGPLHARAGGAVGRLYLAALYPHTSVGTFVVARQRLPARPARWA